MGSLLDRPSTGRCRRGDCRTSTPAPRPCGAWCARLGTQPPTRRWSGASSWQGTSPSFARESQAHSPPEELAPAATAKPVCCRQAIGQSEAAEDVPTRTRRRILRPTGELDPRATNRVAAGPSPPALKRSPAAPRRLGVEPTRKCREVADRIRTAPSEAEAEVGSVDTPSRQGRRCEVDGRAGLGDAERFSEVLLDPAGGPLRREVDGS